MMEYPPLSPEEALDPEVVQEESIPQEEPSMTEPSQPVSPDVEPVSSAEETDPSEKQPEEQSREEKDLSPKMFPEEQPVNQESQPEETEKPAEKTEAVPIEKLLDQLIEGQQAMGERLDGLQELFRNRLLQVEYEEKILDQMHQELKKYRDGLYAQLLKPLLLDVIQIRDSLIRMAGIYGEKPEGQQDIPLKTFSSYALDLQDLLEKNDVEIYQSQPGESFVPVRQRGIKRVAVEDETLHGTVARSLSCGYLYGGKVISPEKVEVYFYEKPVEECKESEEAANG